MKEYIIDGNNVIHKMKQLSVIQQRDPQTARERIAHKIDNYFADKSVKVYIYFDGFENLTIKTSRVKILYSGKSSADSRIRKHIEDSGNPKNIVAVSSDAEIRRLAQACAAATVSSEEFAKIISKSEIEDEEEKRIRSLDNEEFKKLFGSDDD